MGIDLTTVSVSLDILTVNAEAGPDTLPSDIQAIEPIAIWTESTEGRVPIDIDMSEIKISSRYAENYSPVIAYGTEKFSTDKIQIPIIKGIDPLSLINQTQDLPISITNAFASTREIPATSFSLNISNANPTHYTENLTNGTMIRLEDKTRIISNGHTNTTASDLLGAAGAFEMTLANHTNMVGGTLSGGNQSFITAGTHSWTAPAGVTSVAVVCVGTGANGGYQWSSGGGGGGGLGYKNSITVVPGTAYTVVVGAKGSQVSNATNSSGMGGNSYFISEATVCGFGGGRGGTGTTGSNNGGYGGGYTGDGGGRGGNGAWEGSWTRGGGGAGGYSGNGGDGGRNFEGGTLSSGSGGGGGGGNYYSSTYGVGAGGGVGLGGEGTSGAGGVTLNQGFGGRGGSGGQDGLDGENPVNSGGLTTANYQIYGGEYGGGGGGSGTSRGGGYGGIGAVRIVWGASVAFPSTNVGVAPTVGTSTTQVSDPIPVFVENTSHTYSRDEKINHIFKRLSIDTKLSENSNNFDYSSTNITYNPNNSVIIESKRNMNYGSGYLLKDLPIETVAATGRNSIRNDFERLSVETKNEIFTNNIIKLENFKIKRLSIMSETDKSATSPVFCNSISFSFRIKGTDDTEWGHFTDNHIKTMKVLTKLNDPRLTSTSSSSSSSSSDGDSESSGSGGTGPVQSWSS